MGIFDRFKSKKKKDEKPKAEVKQAISKPVKAKEPAPVLKLKSEAAAPEAAKESKSKKVKKDETGLAFKILLKPLITEKATSLVAQNKYAFKVADNSNKVIISKAIKGLYGVEPIAVNIINERGKRLTYGRTRGKKSNWKKAIVTLKSGDKIEIYEGV